MSTCPGCGGAILEPNTNYCYSGRACHCIIENRAKHFSEITSAVRIAQLEAYLANYKRGAERLREALKTIALPFKSGGSVSGEKHLMDILSAHSACARCALAEYDSVVKGESK